MRIANGMVFDGQCFRERDVVVEGDRFARVSRRVQRARPARTTWTRRAAM